MRAVFLVAVVYLIVHATKYRKFSDTPVIDDEIPQWVTSAATAKVFTGDRTRMYPHNVLSKSFTAWTKKRNEELEPWCEKWGVVTTIFDVSEAVHRQVCICTQ